MLVEGEGGFGRLGTKNGSQGRAEIGSVRKVRSLVAATKETRSTEGGRRAHNKEKERRGLNEKPNRKVFSWKEQTSLPSPPPSSFPLRAHGPFLPAETIQPLLALAVPDRSFRTLRRRE